MQIGQQNNPRVSVIIPAWNAEKFLRRAVESVLATKYPHLEIIVIDDGSIDGTWEICKKLEKAHPGQVRIFQRSTLEPRGAAVTRNLGIQKSTGDYIAFLDADDWVYPWRFEEPVSILMGEPHVDAVYGECDIACAENHALDLHARSIANSLSSNDNVGFLDFIQHGLWHTSTVLLRRSLLEKTGVFDPDFKIGQDSHLWFRMVLVGVVRRVKDSRSLSVYFRHPGNRYDPGCHDRGRHTLELLSVWRWAVSRGLKGKTDELYSAWRPDWAENAILMARHHYFETGLRLWKGAVVCLRRSEWLTRRPYQENLQVARAFLRHGAGYCIHRKRRAR